MSLVFAGVCSHAPGITGRAERADPALRDGPYENFGRMRASIEKSGAEALVVIAAEHFANFFMDNMPAFCMGMADDYEGPIEDEAWLGIVICHSHTEGWHIVHKEIGKMFGGYYY
jgi:2,3-dihydroxyphenylpropionate 1,2-dioxygenase